MRTSRVWKRWSERKEEEEEEEEDDDDDENRAYSLAIADRCNTCLLTQPHALRSTARTPEPTSRDGNFELPCELSND